MYNVTDINTGNLTIITDCLLEYVDSFSFVVRNKTELSERGLELIEKLSVFLINKSTTNNWPGTSLMDNYADVYTYTLNINTSLMLRETENNLFNWIEPQLPEDLCFYKSNRPVLISITHEREAYCEYSNSELDVLSRILT